MERLEPNPVILHRLQPLRDQSVEIEVLGPEDLLRLDEEIRPLFVTPTLAAKQVFDVSDKGREDIVAWLCRLPVAFDQQVLVFWPHYRIAVRLRFDSFTNHHDDLWYPAADDLWITDAHHSWLLHFDHEEVLSFWSHPAVSS